MSRFLAGGIIALSALSAAPSVFAHAQLRQAAVPIRRAAADAPIEIRLKFSEGLEPRLTEVALTTHDSLSEPLSPVRIDPVDDSVIVVRLRRALEPGTYKVMWRALSVDTHRTEGSFAFIVAP